MASSSRFAMELDLSIEELLFVRPEYEALNSIVPLRTVGHFEAREWKDNDLKEVVIYSGVQLSEQECLSYGKVWVEQMMSGQISIDTTLIGLRLACSLPNPDQTDWAYVWDQKPEGDTTKPFPELTLSVPILHQPSRGGQQMGDKTSAAAYTFLAAYCMRLLTKSESNLVNSLYSMKSRYQGFFPYSFIVENFDVSLNVAINYKRKLQMQDAITNTYLMWVIASRVADRSVGRKANLLMNYIAYQVFEYSGMIAYKLLKDLTLEAGVTATTLMSNIRSNWCMVAMDGIWDIINNHEKTEAHPNRSVAFRYSRLLNPGYFPDLQTKKCPALCYLFAALYNKYVTPTENANPMKIAGVGNIGEEIKKELDEVATHLFTMFKGMKKNDALAI